MTIEEAIAATLEAWRSPGYWGESDCALSMADYARRLTGTDPGATWRGRYSTPLGASRFIGRAGSLAALFRQGMPEAGQPVATGDVRRGDIVICDLPGSKHICEMQVAGLHLGNLMAFRLPASVALRRYPIVEAWRCA